MALFKDRTTGKRIILKSHHVFGRNKATADTFLKEEDISQIHASVRWNGCHWEMKDLSRNGTWLDHKRLISGNSVYLQKGNVICFAANGKSSWEVINIDPPSAALVPLNEKGPAIKMEGFHVLPDELSPDVSIYIADTGQWVCENESGIAPLNDRDLVCSDSRIWQFFNAEPVDLTIEEGNRYFPRKEIKFHFDVSTDEEHVFLKIIIKDRILDLGERVHHYLLLTLARFRLQDAENGDDPSSQGWVAPDRLSHMLGIDPSHLNIQIFRARKQIYDALPDVLNLPQIIERRVGSLRFGFTNFQIISGSRVEGRMSGESKSYAY